MLALTLFVVRLWKGLLRAFRKKLKKEKKVLDSGSEKVHKRTSRLERNKSVLEVSSKRQSFKNCGAGSCFAGVKISFWRKFGGRFAVGNFKIFGLMPSKGALSFWSCENGRYHAGWPTGVSETCEGWNLEYFQRKADASLRERIIENWSFKGSSHVEHGDFTLDLSHYLRALYAQ